MVVEQSRILNISIPKIVVNYTVKPKTTKTLRTNESDQGLATLLVMISVLAIIVLFCCLAAPGIRDLCNKYIFRHCVIDDPETNNVWNRRYNIDNYRERIDKKGDGDEFPRPHRSSRSHHHHHHR